MDEKSRSVISKRNYISPIDVKEVNIVTKSFYPTTISTSFLINLFSIVGSVVLLLCSFHMRTQPESFYIVDLYLSVREQNLHCYVNQVLCSLLRDLISTSLSFFIKNTNMWFSSYKFRLSRRFSTVPTSILVFVVIKECPMK